MVILNQEQISSLMQNRQNIRNICIFGQNNHGTNTLKNVLNNRIIMHGIEQGKAIFSDIRQDQKYNNQKKLIGDSFYFKCKTQKQQLEQKYLIHMINSTNKIELICQDLRISDGIVVVIDSSLQTLVQVEQILKCAIKQKVKPIFFFNKIDKLLLQNNMTNEQIYQRLITLIKQINDVVKIYGNEDDGGINCDPSKGNIIFGSAKDGWGFSLKSFAKIYSQKFGNNLEKLIEMLWGDHYFDKSKVKWTINPIDDDKKPLQRAFYQFVLTPIRNLCNSIINGNKQQYINMLQTINISLTKQEELYLSEYKVPKLVLSKWLSFTDNLLQMVVHHIPSPVKAQKYKASYIYQGPENDITSQSIRQCNPKGPLVVYVSKMIFSILHGRYYAYGRVFSGTIEQGQKVRIMGPNYKVGSKQDLFIKNVQRICFPAGKQCVNLPAIPCGNIVIIKGIDSYLNRCGTLIDVENSQSYPLRSIRHSSTFPLKISISPKNPYQLPNLYQGMKHLSKVQNLILFQMQDTGQIFAYGRDQVHLNRIVQDLQNQYAKIQLNKSDPIVVYKETITSQSMIQGMTKSAHKHVRLYGRSHPLNLQLQTKIQKQQIKSSQEGKKIEEILANQFNLLQKDANKIWCFGPQMKGPNVLVNNTVKFQNINLIKDPAVAAFQWASKQGVLCQQKMKGFRFDITAAQFHIEPQWRSGGQIIPAAKRLYHGSFLLSNPTLLEPIYQCTITTHKNFLAGVYQTLNLKKCQIIDQKDIIRTPIRQIRTYLPVTESFSFTSLLKGNTQGNAQVQYIFNNWQPIEGLPYTDKFAQNIVVSIRKRKGLKQSLPIAEDYLDK